MIALVMRNWFYLNLQGILFMVGSFSLIGKSVEYLIPENTENRVGPGIEGIFDQKDSHAI